MGRKQIALLESAARYSYQLNTTTITTELSPPQRPPTVALGRNARNPLPSVFFHWCLLTGASAEERDNRGPVRVLGLWIIRGFQRRDTDYWPLNLKITDYFFLEFY